MARFMVVLLACSALESQAVSLPPAVRHAALQTNATAAPSVCGPEARLFASSASSGYLWSNKNGDATCTGSAPYIAPSRLEGGPTWSWKDETASIVSVHPCIDADKNIYVSNRNGVVRKFTPDGRVLWENKEKFTGQRIQVLVGGCAINGGALYVGSADGDVLSISMESGRTNWKVHVAASTGMDSWSLFAHSGLVIAAARNSSFKPSPDFGSNNKIIALDARTGSRQWSFLPDRPAYNFIASFVDDPPSIVFSDWFGTPYRVSLCDGSLLWKNDHAKGNMMSTGGAIVEPSTGRVFVASNAGGSGSGQPSVGMVTAYSVGDGALLWQHNQSMPANNAPSVGRLNPGSSELSVVVAVGQNPYLPDAEAERTGFWSDGTPVAWHSKIFALDAATGKPTGWEYTPEVYRKPQAYGDTQPYHICLPDSWSNSAIGGDGSVYVGHMSGRIFAFRDADGDGVLSQEKGEVSWYFGERCYQGSPGLAPGMLVATPCDGMHVFIAQ